MSKQNDNKPKRKKQAPRKLLESLAFLAMQANYNRRESARHRRMLRLMTKEIDSLSTKIQGFYKLEK